MRERYSDLRKQRAKAAASRRVPAGAPADLTGSPPSGAPPHAETTDKGISEEAERKKKILVVDDSVTNLQMQELTLGENSYNIILARNGREAIAKAVAERPDLILMDVVMPNMDGFQACRWLRSYKGTKDVPIIMMTTRRDEASMKIGYANGCTDYLVKPFESAELLKKVRTYLGEQD